MNLIESLYYWSMYNNDDQVGFVILSSQDEPLKYDSHQNHLFTENSFSDIKWFENPHS